MGIKMENIMGKVYDFLQKCGVFYVLTLNGGRPEGRPFGAVMEAYGKLFFSTAKTKQVYKQLTHNPINRSKTEYKGVDPNQWGSD